MTLLLNEIHVEAHTGRSLVLCAADSRLSEPDGACFRTRRKLIEVPHLSAAVSYFGLAVFRRTGGGQLVFIDEILRAFVRKAVGKTIAEFSLELRKHMAEKVPSQLLRHGHSGFHICGYNGHRVPDFWFFSNIETMSGLEYTDLCPTYGQPSSHFLGRDAANVWDPSARQFKTNLAKLYRNGDLGVHVVLARQLDTALDQLQMLPNFPMTTGPRDFGLRARSKLEIIGFVARKWSSAQFIGGPFRVLVYHCDGPDQAICRVEL